MDKIYYVLDEGTLSQKRIWGSVPLLCVKTKYVAGKVRGWKSIV